MVNAEMYCSSPGMVSWLKPGYDVGVFLGARLVRREARLTWCRGERGRASMLNEESWGRVCGGRPEQPFALAINLSSGERESSTPLPPLSYFIIPYTSAQRKQRPHPLSSLLRRRAEPLSCAALSLPFHPTRSIIPCPLSVSFSPFDTLPLCLYSTTFQYTLLARISVSFNSTASPSPSPLLSLAQLRPPSFLSPPPPCSRSHQPSSPQLQMALMSSSPGPEFHPHRSNLFLSHHLTAPSSPTLAYHDGEISPSFDASFASSMYVLHSLALQLGAPAYFATNPLARAGPSRQKGQGRSGIMAITRSQAHRLYRWTFHLHQYSHKLPYTLD